MTCQWSTTAMLGKALGTPVAVFDFHRSPSGDMWKGESGLPFAQSRAEFVQLLRSCVIDEEARAAILEQRRQFVAEFLCLDGQATERLVSLVRKQAGLPTPEPISQAA